MTVYFSGSARDITDKQAAYKAILESIREAGGIIVNGWVEVAMGRDSLPETEGWWERICDEAQKGIEDADMVIIEASGASCFGAGYELAIALQQQKPVLLLINEVEKNQSYALGLHHLHIEKFFYTSANIKGAILDFIKEKTR